MRTSLSVRSNSPAALVGFSIADRGLDFDDGRLLGLLVYADRDEENMGKSLMFHKQAHL